MHYTTQSSQDVPSSYFRVWERIPVTGLSCTLMKMKITPAQRRGPTRNRWRRTHLSGTIRRQGQWANQESFEIGAPAKAATGTWQNNKLWRRVFILGLFVSVKVNARGTSSRSLWRCWKSSKWQSRVIWMTKRRPSWWTRGSMTAPSTRPRSRICSINWTRTSVTPAATLGTISASGPRPNPHSNLFSAQARTYYKKVRKTNTRYYYKLQYR